MILRVRSTNHPSEPAAFRSTKQNMPGVRLKNTRRFTKLGDSFKNLQGSLGHGEHQVLDRISLRVIVEPLEGPSEQLVFVLAALLGVIGENHAAVRNLVDDNGG